jgi:hypothetical protein
MIMTKEFELALESTMDALENLTEQAEGMRVLEIVFSLERISGKANEMIRDLQFAAAMHTEGREIPSRHVYEPA